MEHYSFHLYISFLIIATFGQLLFSLSPVHRNTVRRLENETKKTQQRQVCCRVQRVMYNREPAPKVL